MKSVKEDGCSLQLDGGGKLELERAGERGGRVRRGGGREEEGYEEYDYVGALLQMNSGS